MNKVRPLRWRDLPFVYQFVGQGISFDDQFRLTVGENGLRQALLTSTKRSSLYVLQGNQTPAEGLAQLYFPVNTHQARLAYLSPGLEPGENNDLWLSLLDGLTAMAGEQGATCVIAEVPEDSAALEVLRQANFAIYARQKLWVRPPQPIMTGATTVPLRQADDADVVAMQSIYGALVPGLIKQVEPPPPGSTDQCFVLDDHASGGLHGLVAIYRGGRQTLIEGYLHPEVHELSGAIINTILTELRADTQTVYFRQRQYMGWLDEHLDTLGFVPSDKQAMMVRHTAARIIQPAFKPLPALDGSVSTLTTSMHLLDLEGDLETDQLYFYGREINSLN